MAASGASTAIIDNMTVASESVSRAVTNLDDDMLSAGTTAAILITTSESIDTRQDLQVVLGSGASAVTAFKGPDGGWQPFYRGHFPTWYGYFAVARQPGHLSGFHFWARREYLYQSLTLGPTQSGGSGGGELGFRPLHARNPVVK